MSAGRGFLRVYGKDLIAFQKIMDPVLAGLLFSVISFSSGQVADKSIILPASFAIGLLAAVFLNKNKVYHGYRLRSMWILLNRLTEGWIQLLASLVFIGYLSRLSTLISRADFVLWALLGWLQLVCIHVGSQKALRYLRTKGGNTQSIVFLGTPDAAVDFYNQLSLLPYLGMKMVSWFSLSDMPDTSLQLPSGMPSLAGNINDLSPWLRKNHVDQLHFSWSRAIDQDDSASEIISILGNTSKPVYYVPSWSHPAMRFEVDQVGTKFLIGLWGGDHSLFKLRLKYFCDFIVAALLLLLLSPLFLLLAFIIKKTSPGPILFKQDRYGVNGNRFKIYKFRSMTVLESGDNVNLKQACKDDSRVTSIGKLMRRWSLDELPQLLNVLNGTMSLVGPRPHAVTHNEIYRKQIVGYMQRHQLKPGITGLAQVRGFRGETSELSSMENRVEADLSYMKDWSLRLDITILFRTLISFHSQNAY